MLSITELNPSSGLSLKSIGALATFETYKNRGEFHEGIRVAYWAAKLLSVERVLTISDRVQTRRIYGRK